MGVNKQQDVSSFRDDGQYRHSSKHGQHSNDGQHWARDTSKSIWDNGQYSSQGSRNLQVPNSYPQYPGGGHPKLEAGNHADYNSCSDNWLAWDPEHGASTVLEVGAIEGYTHNPHVVAMGPANRAHYSLPPPHPQQHGHHLADEYLADEYSTDESSESEYSADESSADEYSADEEDHPPHYSKCGQPEEPSFRTMDGGIPKIHIFLPSPGDYPQQGKGGYGRQGEGSPGNGFGSAHGPWLEA